MSAARAIPMSFRDKKMETGARPKPDPGSCTSTRDYFADVLSSEQWPGPVVPSLYEPRIPASVVKSLLVAVPVFGQLVGVLPACEKNASEAAMALVTVCICPAAFK